MAVFCDFENVALGVRDANYEKFDIKPILERLLLKGSIVVKKAYCDWDRYKSFKATMHEANFELIEIPHVRQSGKNSADIRLVVDALDLCYTKSHVNTFVIISGDSDFSPLVSKLRENAKQVIGVGVKQSTSDLLVANCDEFIFYDDLVRESRRTAAKRDSRDARESSAPKRTPDEEIRRKEKYESRMTQAIDMAVETFDALVSERGDSGKIWASMLKEAIKRRKPDFSESYYGFRTFGNLLEEAQARGLLEFGRDEKSGAYVYRSSGALPRTEAAAEHLDAAAPGLDAPLAVQAEAPEQGGAKRESRRNGRGGRKSSERGEKSGHRGQGTPHAYEAQEQAAPEQVSDSELDSMDLADTLADAANNGNLIDAAGAANVGNATGNASGEKRESRRNGRGGRKQSGSGRGEKSASNGQRGQNAPYGYGAPERPAGRLPVFDVEDDEPERPAGRLPVFDAEDDEPERTGPLPVFDTDDEVEADSGAEVVAVAEVPETKREPRRNSRGGRKSGAGRGEKSSANANRHVGIEAVAELAPVPAAVVQPIMQPEVATEVTPQAAGEAPQARAKARSPRKPAAKKAGPAAAEAAPEAAQEVVPAVQKKAQRKAPVAQAASTDTPAKPARKPAARGRRPAKADAPDAE